LFINSIVYFPLELSLYIIQREKVPLLIELINKKSEVVLSSGHPVFVD